MTKQVNRYSPTTKGAAVIRSALADAGIKARVAKQRFAYRVISDDSAASDVLLSIGLRGPVGGSLARNGLSEYFAYDFARLA